MVRKLDNVFARNRKDAPVVALSKHGDFCRTGFRYSQVIQLLQILEFLGAIKYL